jgi:predicted outer membrane protein
MLQINRYSNYLLLPLIAAAILLLATGCGSSSDASSSDATSSKASTADGNSAEAVVDDDVDDADDALLIAYESGFLKLGPQMDTVGDKFGAAEDIAGFTAARVALQVAIAELNQLNPPDEIEADHKRLYAALRRALVETKKVTETSTEASDNAAAEAAGAALEDASAAVDAISEQLG